MTVWSSDAFKLARAINWQRMRVFRIYNLNKTSCICYTTLVSITQDRWNEEQCRIENGIFFTTDDVALLEGNPEGGYRVSARIPLSTLLDREPDGWTAIIMNPTCQVDASSLLVSAGATAWEGEGFIAVQEATSGTLVWLLHLCESEAFVDVHFVGDTILAVSAAHPHRHQWKIPLHNPALLQLVM